MILCFTSALFAQKADSALDGIAQFPNRFLAGINNKTSHLKDQLIRQSEKYLRHLSRKEDKLKRKLYKQDSSATRNLFAGDSSQQLGHFLLKLKSDSNVTGGMIGQYMPYVDSLNGALSFLNKYPSIISSSKIFPADIQNSLKKLQVLQVKMQGAEQVRQFMAERKEQIRQYLQRYEQAPPSILKLYNDYNKQLFYYSQQIREYKNMLNEPDKMLMEALVLLDKLSIFRDFMSKNSMLASLFPMPSNYGTPQAIAGLQTRDQIQQILQGRLSLITNAQGASGFDLNAAKSQLDNLKDRLMKYGEGGADIDMPNFKPNEQKTKTFIKRLEYGLNLQTQHANYFFPTTSDIGLSVGYKLNNSNVVGVGASYKVGWGKDISHVQVSNQGAGLRSFVDVQMKGNLFVSGGFEYNYQHPFGSFQQIRVLDIWEKSGLIGLSKIVALKSGALKKTKVQILWDFLSYQQVPRTQPIKFRIGWAL